MVLEVLDLIAVVVLVALLFVAAVVGRRLLIQRGGGTVDCSVRLDRPGPGRRGRGWSLGLGRYAGDRLEWFRIFSLSPNPRWTPSRGDLVITSRRPAKGAELVSLPAAAVVIECEVWIDGATKVVEVAMGEAAFTGFRAWLEAAPPGAHLDRR